MKILLIDNYDSFTYNLFHILRELGTETDVVRNDKIDIDRVEDYDKIILSPGPGIPSEAGLMPAIVKRYATTKSIFGVCLGEQALGENFGANLINLAEVYHGVQNPVNITVRDYIFEGLPDVIEVGRYHSWVVDSKSLPDCLEIICEDVDGKVMAIRHKTLDIRGVQFHPESVLTPLGRTIMENFVRH